MVQENTNASGCLLVQHQKQFRGNEHFRLYRHKPARPLVRMFRATIRQSLQLAFPLFGSSALPFLHATFPDGNMLFQSIGKAGRATFLSMIGRSDIHPRSLAHLTLFLDLPGSDIPRLSPIIISTSITLTYGSKIL